MIEHDNFEHRISRMEAWREGQDKISERLANSIERLNSILGEVTLKIDRMTHQPMCPKPGLCLELEQTVGEHGKALRELLDDKQFAIRGWKAVGVIAGTATGIIATLYAAWQGVAHLVDHIKKP